MKASHFLLFRLPSTVYFMLPTYVSREKWKHYYKLYHKIFPLKMVALLRINVKITKYIFVYVSIFIPLSSFFICLSSHIPAVHPLKLLKNTNCDIQQGIKECNSTSLLTPISEIIKSNIDRFLSLSRVYIDVFRFFNIYEQGILETSTLQIFHLPITNHTIQSKQHSYS